MTDLILKEEKKCLADLKLEDHIGISKEICKSTSCCLKYVTDYQR